MMYMMHIASFLGLIVVAAGFVAFHFACEEKSKPLKIAGWILTVGGVLGLLCMIYYSLLYWRQGYFTMPMSMHQMSMAMPMQGGMMQGGSMMGGKMPMQMPMQQPAASGANPSDHEEHHPAQ